MVIGAVNSANFLKHEDNKSGYHIVVSGKTCDAALFESMAVHYQNSSKIYSLKRMSLEETLKFARQKGYDTRAIKPYKCEENDRRESGSHY